MKKPTHFIIVDDDAINNTMCRFSISKHFADAEIHTFENPEIALTEIAKGKISSSYPPAILFLDINMPLLSGWEFLDRFAELDPKIHKSITIYMLTSSSSPRDKEMAAAHPFVIGFIEKPLTGAKLENVFRALPESYGARAID